MLTRYQFLMGKIAEEASEIAQRAAKCQQFGGKELEPGQDLNNDYRLWREVQDLYAVLEIVDQEYKYSFTRDVFCITAKVEKLDKFYRYSQSLGMVQ